MKKFFIISVLAALFGLTSCTGFGDDIVGRWEGTKMSMDVDGTYIEIPLEQQGMSLEFTFKSNGNGTMVQTIDGERVSGDFTYTLNGSRLTISSDGESMSFPVTIDGDDMIMEWSEEMLGTDYPVNLHFIRK